jgi:hypothetical protein
VRLFLAKKILGFQDSISAFADEIPEDDAGTLSPKTLAMIQREIQPLRHDVDQMEFPLTRMAIDRFIGATHPITNETAFREIMEIWQRFADELEAVSFVYVEREKLRYYEQDAAFGILVGQRFPSADYDIREAANCFSLERHTATVMHSMRALEVGLDALGAALKIKRSLKGWGADLQIFGDAWSKQLKMNPRLSGWKREFFPKAFVEFRHFANAWRNRAMHSGVQYGDEEASRVFEHVGSFLRHLATRLSEPRKRKRR